MLRNLCIFLSLFSGLIFAQTSQAQRSRWILKSSNSLQHCQRIVNSNGQEVDNHCPMGPPFYDVGTLYQSDNAGDFRGGSKHNCTWPGHAYAYIWSIDEDGTCHVVTANSIDNFGSDFHGVCLGTYYIASNVSHKNLNNVGWEMSSGFASDPHGDNCFEVPGSESVWCQGEDEASCFAVIRANCHVHIEQQGNITCPTAGTGD